MGVFLSNARRLAWNTKSAIRYCAALAGRTAASAALPAIIRAYDNANSSYTTPHSPALPINFAIQKQMPFSWAAAEIFAGKRDF